VPFTGLIRTCTPAMNMYLESRNRTYHSLVSKCNTQLFYLSRKKLGLLCAAIVLSKVRAKSLFTAFDSTQFPDKAIV